MTRSRRIKVAGAFVAASVALTGSAAPALAGDRLSGDSTEAIAITEQASDQILVLASEPGAWEKATISWRWKPTATNGFADLVDNWGLPDEAKLRHRGDQAYLLTADSYGLAAVVPYPQGTGAYWAADVGRANNPHSIELLPDGNVAVAASAGGWVRVFTASQGSASTTYTEFKLEDAHGVYWDADRSLLWAIGAHELVGLRLSGPASAPVVTKVRGAALPTNWGHDLQPVAVDPDRLWLTTGSQVYQYSIRQNAFLQDFLSVSAINQAGVKSIGDERQSGQVLGTFVQTGNICTWCTDTVSLYEGEQAFQLHGAQIYKTRWWVDPNRD
ncbi:DUF6528 family protein [Flindersiella endophytica]